VSEFVSLLDFMFARSNGESALARTLVHQWDEGMI